MKSHKPYKYRIKPKNAKDIAKYLFFILIACMAFLSPFYAYKSYVYGRSEVQQDIRRAIETQDNIKLDRIIISPAMGRHNDYSVVFLAENWEG